VAKIFGLTGIRGRGVVSLFKVPAHTHMLTAFARGWFTHAPAARTARRLPHRSSTRFPTSFL